MFKLERHILIQERPRVVWSFLATLPVSQSCRRSRRSFRWLDNPTPGVGSRYMMKIHFLGIGYRQEGKIAGWEPPSALTLVVWSHRFPRIGFTYQCRYAIEVAAGQTEVTTLYSIIIGSFKYRLFEWAFKEIINRGLMDHLILLKRAIESTSKDDQRVRQAAHSIAEVPVAGG